MRSILNILRSFFIRSFPLFVVAGSYGAVFWLQLAVVAGRGIANTPNASPFTLSGIYQILLATFNHYPDPLWILALVPSAWVLIRTLRERELFLAGIYVSLILGVFIAFIPFPTRVVLFFWAPVLSGFGAFMEIWWEGSFASWLALPDRPAGWKLPENTRDADRRMEGRGA